MGNPFSSEAGSPSAPPSRCGFANFGNTCYINSVLQVLHHTKDFQQFWHERDIFLRDPTPLPDIAAMDASEHVQKTADHEAAVAVGNQRAPLGSKTPPPGGSPGPSTPTKQYTDTVPMEDDVSMASTTSGSSSSSAARRKQQRIEKMAPLSPLAVGENGSHTISTTKTVKPLLMSALARLYMEQSNTELKNLLHEVDSLSEHQFASNAQLQHDAQEFFYWMRERMIKEVPQMKGMFQGKIICETKCSWCEKVSERQEPFLDLQIQIQNHTSLSQCLKNYEKVEFLGGQNKFYCEKCCTLQEARKRDKILQLPKILCIQLKRFQFSEKTYSFQKLMHRVAFSKELRLSTHNEEEDFFYELYAVILHVGHTPHSGHYKSIAKTADGWYMFDDDRIIEFDGNFEKYFGGCLETPYMLFYTMVHVPS